MCDQKCSHNHCCRDRQKPDKLYLQQLAAIEQAAGQQQVMQYVVEQAKAFGVPATIALATAAQESSFNLNVPMSKTNDVGVMQVNLGHVGRELTDASGKSYVVSGDKLKNDWRYNVRAGMSILRDSYRFASKHAPNDVVRATYARYNAGGSWHNYTKPGTLVHAHVQSFYRHYLEFQNQ